MKKKNGMHPAAGVLPIFLALASFSSAEVKAPLVPVTVDPRVELVSIIFRLAGNPEYCQGQVPSYNQDIDRHFAGFGKHPAVQMARMLRSLQGVGYNAVMDIAVHASDVNAMEPRIPLSPRPESMDPRWTPRSAMEFLRAAKSFAQESKFGDFFSGHPELYRTACERMQAVLEKNGHLEWLDAFFGGKRSGAFKVMLGLVNGPCNYGAKISLAPRGEEIYSIIGVWETDASGQPAIPGDVAETVVHEFTHSYTNPLVDRYAGQLRPAGEKIFAKVANEMKRQAYSDWKTLMYESINRACTLRHTLAFGGPEAFKRGIAYEKSKSFFWVGDLAEMLGEYDTRARRYRDLDDFFPKIVAFFNDYARDVDQKLAAIKAVKK